MSNRNSILIITGVLLLLVGGLTFWYISSNKTPTGTNTFTPNQTNTSNPFGNNSVNKPNSTSTGSINDNQNTTKKNTAKLIRVYSNPTSGSIFSTNKSNQDVLMFVDRSVGHTYEYIPADQTGEANRLTNTTIPKIQEAVWSNTGSNLVFRYLDNDTDTITSFNAKISTGQKVVGVPGEITGSFLTSNIKQLAINPKGDKIFSIVDKSDKSGTYGFTTNIDGGSKTAIFESPISYWNISWPKDNIITFTTKPSYKDYGLLYFFNTQKSSMDRILGNFTGLSTLTNKDTTLVAYSYSLDNAFALDVYDVVNKISKNIKILTLADKCVWGNNNAKVLYCAIPQTIITDNYPDAWYQGIRSFTDDIWMVDTEQGTAKELYKIGSNENSDIDAYDLKISPDDKYLSFSNKNDLSLWVLDLTQE